MHLIQFLVNFYCIIGVIYARYEGIKHLRSGFSQLSKNELPAYEIISGAAIAFGALLLIVPGFATDLIGFLLIFPITRKLIFGKISKNFKKKQWSKKSFYRWWVWRYRRWQWQKNYKILAKFIKDMSSETARYWNLFIVKENISKYQLNIDIKFKST